MLYLLPENYPEFHCLADQCEDTCCAGWQITVDQQSLKKYRAYRGSYRKVLLKSIQWKEKVFRQDREKRCAFLNEENLCEMYRHLGSDSLCRTCRQYPRHVEEFENVREISLSISCPEAARMLLERTEPLRFREFYREGEETYEEFDELLYSQLTEGRGRMIRILQNRELPLKLRIGLVCGLANDMEKRLAEGRLFSVQELFERVEKAALAVTDPADRSVLCRAEQKMSCSSSENYAWIRELFGQLKQFEFLKEDWPLWLSEAENRLYAQGEEVYAAMEREFYEWLRAQKQDWEIPFEQLMVYFLFSYFCGAVYDGEIRASAQLGAAHCWLIKEMLMAVWLRNGKQLEPEDLKELVVRYSRELEHSDLNQKQMEKLMIRKRLPWLKKKETKEEKL